MELKDILQLNKMDKIEILNNYTLDNQENIRFVESKTAFLTAILGAIIIYYLQGIENITKYYYQFSNINLFFFYLLVVIVIVSIYFLIKVIYPKSNPILNLPSTYKDYPNLYLSREKLNNKKSDLNDYQKVFKNDKNTFDAVELEFLKTSYIRNEKLFNFKIVFILTTIIVIIFTTHLIILQNELNKLIP